MKGEAWNQPHLGGREKLLLLGPPQPGPWAAPQMAAMSLQYRRRNVGSPHAGGLAKAGFRPQ